MEERRREKRAGEFQEIKEINRQPGDGSHILDLSPSGAKLETTLTFSLGEAVEFAYLKPGEAQETRHWGQVVWVLPSPTKPGRYLLGVEFLLPGG
ncbi:MAG: hypothetical protein A2Z73_04445 [Deltaproteobacteria bacterium RBG_13_60_28]|nr:MAG: hypothetical protein A2Z73_04445 [Deltaproteobacteria bacterium RBG_13_60_28]